MPRIVKFANSLLLETSDDSDCVRIDPGSTLGCILGGSNAHD
jgi:hypothetical protein